MAYLFFKQTILDYFFEWYTKLLDNANFAQIMTFENAEVMPYEIH